MPISHLRACGAVHYQHQNPLDSQKSTSSVNDYISINMTKSQDDTNKNKTKLKQKNYKRRRSTSTVSVLKHFTHTPISTSTINAYISINMTIRKMSFYIRRNRTDC